MDDLTLSVYDLSTESQVKVKAYKKSRKGMYVPRQYALRKVDGVFEIDFKTSEGHPLNQSRFRKTPALRKYQIPVIEKMVGLYKDGYIDTRMESYTGSGKTLMSIEICRRIGRNFLVIVDQELIRDEWIKNLKTHYGVTDRHIGLVQGDTWDYEDKVATICMAQTLLARKDSVSKDFLSYFGVCVIDEVHRIGAPKMSEILFMVNSDFRFGVSAEPYRKDGLGKVLECHLGDIDVRLNKKHSSNVVRVVKFPGVFSWYSNTSPKTGRYLNEVAEDPLRNVLLSTILKRFYDSGRYALCLSARISQLYVLREWLIQLGVGEEDIGMAAGKKLCYKYAIDTSDSSLLPVGYVKGTKYTPVCLQLVEKKTPRAEINAAKDKKVILGTYSLLSTGIDIDHISAGVEGTPMAKAKQSQGRILREAVGKLLPVWVTIWDYGSSRAAYQLRKRLDDYVQSNSEIKLWRLDKGIKKVREDVLKRELDMDYRNLKAGKIITSLRGFYISRMVKESSRYEIPTLLGIDSPKVKPKGR